MLAQQSWDSAPIQSGQYQLTAQMESAYLNQYSHLVQRAALHLKSMIGPVVDRDDLLQVGLMGLLSAIRRYGRAADEAFESYAFKRIRGAMLDEFRQADWRPRDLRREAHQLRDASRELSRQLQKTPTKEELAAHLGSTPEKIQQLEYALQAEALESLQQLLERQQEPESFAEGKKNQLELQLSLRKAMRSLPERNKLLLHLYYNLELNMKEIALVLKLTESRVCQLHKQSIHKLSQVLSTDQR